MSRSLTAFPSAKLIGRLKELEVQKLPNREETFRQQTAMLARFHRHGLKRKRWSRLQRCNGGTCAHRRCSAACWFGGRAMPAHLTSQAYNLLHDLDLPMFFVTVVLPQYRRAPGRLRRFSPNSLRQWLQRRLKGLEALRGPLLVLGSIEVSLELELDGKTFWGPHVHFVVAGRVTQTDLKKGLRPTKRSPKGFRPVVASPITNLANAVSYAMKRAPEMRKAVVGKSGRQDRLPSSLSPERAVELDRWLLRLNVDDLLILRGVKRVHGRLTLIRGARSGTLV